MTLARKNAQLAQTISVSGNAVGDTLFIPSSGLVNVSGILTVNDIPVSVSGHSHTAFIGNGSSGVISYDISQNLNIVGSGSTVVNYDDSTKTVNVSSPEGIREYELITSEKSVFTVTGGYDTNNLDVFHNGIKLLASGDYTATNGSTFTLIQPAINGDVVEWLAYVNVSRSQLVLGEVRSDTVGSTNYVGRAVGGSLESDNVWTIKKYEVASNGIDIITTTATNAVWDNRYSETYV